MNAAGDIGDILKKCDALSPSHGEPVMKACKALVSSCREVSDEAICAETLFAQYRQYLQICDMQQSPYKLRRKDGSSTRGVSGKDDCYVMARSEAERYRPITEEEPARTEKKEDDEEDEEDIDGEREKTVECPSDTCWVKNVTLELSDTIESTPVTLWRTIDGTRKGVQVLIGYSVRKNGDGDAMVKYSLTDAATGSSIGGRKLRKLSFPDSGRMSLRIFVGEDMSIEGGEIIPR